MRGVWRWLLLPRATEYHRITSISIIFGQRVTVFLSPFNRNRWHFVCQGVNSMWLECACVRLINLLRLQIAGCALSTPNAKGVDAPENLQLFYLVGDSYGWHRFAYELNSSYNTYLKSKNERTKDAGETNDLRKYIKHSKYKSHCYLHCTPSHRWIWDNFSWFNASAVLSMLFAVAFIC